jgi:hypothetical protein
MDPATEEILDGDTVWRFDREFLTSRWTCLWGRGCHGIGPEPAAHLGLGCCSIGADLGDTEEARLIAALAATLEPARFERHAEAAEGGIFSDGTRTHTRVVDGACIFLNRPGFVGGCAGSYPSRWTGRRAPTIPKWRPCVAGRDATGGQRARRWRGAALRVRWPMWVSIR